MNTFKLEIITPQSAFPARDVISVDVPAEEGRLTVLAGHQPFVCAVRDGEVRIGNIEGGTETWTVERGALTVTPETATLLVRSAANAETLTA